MLEKDVILETKIRLIILDEADKIIEDTSEEFKQRIFEIKSVWVAFSATYTEWNLEMLKKKMNRPVFISTNDSFIN